MSLHEVERKLLASAEAEAREIAEQAESEARTALERGAARLREEQARALAAAHAAADSGAEQAVNSRRAEHAMAVLRAKNEILDWVFGTVRERALAADGFDYGRWLARQVRRVCARGVPGTLYCTARDRAAVEAIVREAGGKGITLAPEPGLMHGGVYLVGAGIELDLTLESAIDSLRDELAVSLAERLFGDVPPIAGGQE